ncbi:MAG: sulfatase-like hydrolase/transferase [Burkholderiales bacterium]|nr:sulfatase-like hydrolase/transferase [Burkholderiales bacterium]
MPIEAAATAATAAADRPNFLLIMTDQQRADHLGAYGNALLRTPNIDALARDGVAFDRFYVSSPVCMPNRAALATGRMPSAAGVRMNGVPLPLSARTFADALGDAGYRTALIGKAHFQNMTDAAPTPAPGEPATPRGRQGDADLRDGPEYGCESPARWADPKFRVPVPYYGFGEVELCLEHGDAVGGDFARWLARSGSACKPGAEGALPPGAPILAPQAWRTALPESHYPTAFIAQRSIDWLRRHATQHPDRPFLMQCSFPDPHHPFTPPGRYWSMYAPHDVELPASFAAPIGLAPPHKRALHEELARGERRTGGSRVIAVTEDEARQAIALNYGAVAMIDDAVGRVIAALAELDLDRNTVVIFLSDHGDFMGDHGLLFKGPLHYRSVVRMPFIWRDTAAAARRGRRGNIASAIDLAPTILDRAGVAGFHGMQGRSLLPIMNGRDDAREGCALIEEEGHRPVPGLPVPARARSLVTDRFRLSIYPGVDWAELYDLAADPHEIHNRFADPDLASTRSELLWRLGTEMSRLATGLPLATRMA